MNETAVSDAEAFSTLYRREYAAVLHFIERRAQPGSQAEDLTNEVFLAAWRRFADLPTDIPAARGWLFTTARNQLRHAVRSEIRHNRFRQALEGAAVPVVAPADQTISEHAAIASAWNSLSATDQEVIALTAWDELTSEQAAQVLGIKAPAYRRRLSRARATLRAALASNNPAYH